MTKDERQAHIDEIRELRRIAIAGQGSRQQELRDQARYATDCIRRIEAHLRQAAIEQRVDARHA